MLDIAFAPIGAFLDLAGAIGYAAIVVVPTVFWVWMLVDCLLRETDHNNNRLIWTLVIVFTSWVGALLYFFIRRPQRIERFESERSRPAA